ncbi:hypothetical protein ABVT39_014051 [Epinephelus coioides]
MKKKKKRPRKFTKKEHANVPMDKTSQFSRPEFESFLFEMTRWFSDHQLQVDELFSHSDADRSGSVNLKDFYLGLMNLDVPCQQFQLHMLTQQLKTDDNMISYRDLSTQVQKKLRLNDSTEIDTQISRCDRQLSNPEEDMRRPVLSALREERQLALRNPVQRHHIGNGDNLLRSTWESTSMLNKTMTRLEKKMMRMRRVTSMLNKRMTHCLVNPGCGLERKMMRMRGVKFKRFRYWDEFADSDSSSDSISGWDSCAEDTDDDDLVYEEEEEDPLSQVSRKRERYDEDEDDRSAKKSRGFIRLSVRAIPFDPAAAAHPGNFEIVLLSSIRVLSLIRTIQERVGIQTTRLEVFRSRVPTEEARLPPGSFLEECGFRGGPEETPPEDTVYYDYMLLFTDCPILNCDHYFSSGPDSASIRSGH